MMITKKLDRKHRMCFLKLDPAQSPLTEKIVSAYLDSKAFDGDDYRFFEYLKKTEAPIAHPLITAAEQLIARNLGGDSLGRAFRDFHSLHELLRIEYTASENDPDLRKRLLDVIDLCLEQNIYGTEDILKAHDRAA